MRHWWDTISSPAIRYVKRPPVVHMAVPHPTPRIELSRAELELGEAWLQLSPCRCSTAYASVRRMHARGYAIDCTMSLCIPCLYGGFTTAILYHHLHPLCST
jgi:hypothetical protein